MPVISPFKTAGLTEQEPEPSSSRWVASYWPAGPGGGCATPSLRSMPSSTVPRSGPTSLVVPYQAHPAEAGLAGGVQGQSGVDPRRAQKPQDVRPSAVDFKFDIGGAAFLAVPEVADVDGKSRRPRPDPRARRRRRVEGRTRRGRERPRPGSAPTPRQEIRKWAWCEKLSLSSQISAGNAIKSKPFPHAATLDRLLSRER